MSIEYVSAAMKTAADLGSPILNLTHAALGLVDEAEELANSQPGSPNEMEELGDALWFAALAGKVAADAIGADVWSGRDHGAFVSPRAAITGCACQVAGLVKKPFAYGVEAKPIPWPEIVERVREIISAIEDVARRRGWTLEQVQAANIGKLSRRYKGAEFNAKHAANRDTSAELEAIMAHTSPGPTQDQILEFVRDAVEFGHALSMDERDALVSRFSSAGYLADSKFFRAHSGNFWVVKATAI